MARSLGGTDSDKIDCTSASILSPTTAMTFVCWAYAVTFPHAYNVICKRINVGSTAYYAFQPKSTGKLAFYYVDSVGLSRAYDGTGTNTLVANTWYHLAFVVPGSAAATGYVNGSLDGTASYTNPGISAISGHPTTLGWDFVTVDSGWNGRLADAAIYNVGLTVNELLSLYGGARPYQIRPTALVGYWPLDGLSSPEPDFSGNANNGTLTGTAFAAGPPVTLFTPRWRQLVLPSSAPAVTSVFRKSASRIGTRTGTRQTWAA